jgi:RNA polymerase sigma-70 factor (family 1)
LEEASIISKLQERIALYEDMKAYKQLYEIFFHRLLRFSCSFIKSREAAEEIVSDVFIKIWEIRSSLTDITHLPVYLYTITKNFSLNYITRSRKLRVISLEDMGEEVFLNLITPEDSLISAETLAAVNAAINRLPPQCRIIFYLVKESSLKYKEVAAVLNISVNTVRNQVAIATQRIAGSLPPSLTTRFLSFSKFSDS